LQPLHEFAFALVDCRLGDAGLAVAFLRRAFPIVPAILVQPCRRIAPRPVVGLGSVASEAGGYDFKGCALPGCSE